MYILLFTSVALALGLAAYNFYSVKKLSPGTDVMQEIAEAIQVGAAAFINHEYKMIAKIAVVIAATLAVLVCRSGFFDWGADECNGRLYRNEDCHACQCQGIQSGKGNAEFG